MGSMSYSQRRRLSESMKASWRKRKADAAEKSLFTLLFFLFLLLIAIVFLATHPGVIFAYLIKALFWKSLAGHAFWIVTGIFCLLILIGIMIAARDFGTGVVLYFMLSLALLVVELGLYWFFHPGFLHRMYLTAYPSMYSNAEVALFEETNAADEKLPLTVEEIEGFLRNYYSPQTKKLSKKFESVRLLATAPRFFKNIVTPAKEKDEEPLVNTISYWPIVVEITYSNKYSKKKPVFTENTILYLAHDYALPADLHLDHDDVRLTNPVWQLQTVREVKKMKLPVDEIPIIAKSFDIKPATLGIR